MAVERTAVNPVAWSAALGFHQGEVVSGHTRTLYISGQTAMNGDGVPQHDGDMAGQLALSADNVEAVLGEAGMSLADLVRLTVYTTDVDLLLRAGDRPPHRRPGDGEHAVVVEEAEQVQGGVAQ
ncbi:RidA family protein, partial [Streptomyces zhihengii]|uniref:RidA family protein n=1 Tax=Streptomyces zhihengii TaxID=1818004 RepID=UPI00345341DB